MPTTKPRHLITETPEVASALDAAARRWPDDSRSKLLVRLVAEGHRAMLDASDARIAARREAIERTSGALNGTYDPDYLATLREDWPA